MTKTELDQTAAALKAARWRVWRALLDCHTLVEAQADAGDPLAALVAEETDAAFDHMKAEQIAASSQLEEIRNG